MPGTLKKEKLTSHTASDLRQLTIQYNKLAQDVAAMQQASLTDQLLGWYGVGANSGADRMARGSTDTQVGLAAMVLAVAGVPVVKAASAGGTTFGALGTIPASTWGLIAIDVVAAGTLTFRSAAANYTTGYATEALAIAAKPARLTVKAEVGYVTILASSSTWVAATDALAGGSSGNPATTTNYYPNAGIYAPTGTAIGPNGNVTAFVSATGSPWIGGKNGVLIATSMAIGSTDTRWSTTAFTYNANGLTNIPKAADAAGTAFGALGTIPADKWGLIIGLIDGAGTKTFMAAPASFTTGYTTEAQAIADLNNIYPTANTCMYGYATIKTGSGLAWITGTDALAGGTTGNEASATNYYPTGKVSATPLYGGITLATGESASLIANREGVIVGDAQY